MQCSVGQKRDESAGPCTPDCDRRPAGPIDEAEVDGVKHRAAPARVNKVRVPQADPLPCATRRAAGRAQVQTKQRMTAGGGADRRAVIADPKR